ncbi:MAG: bifunctional polysaccharide deacetylase/glycosyltransferase family 2 protein [Hyphomonadaceae bacterium]
MPQSFATSALWAPTCGGGPDPRWTPPILDILRRMHAPATFFVVGDSVLAHTEILRRMLREGHDVGSHTFTHPNIGEISDAGAEFELNETERVIEALANVRPLLFRPPYAEDIEPETIDDARVVGIASRLGYTTLGLRVDPGDWTRPGADRIVEETMAQVEAGRGHVVLLHDSGGDRSQTVAALPRIIARLRADGWRFVTAHELLGLSRAALMPRPPPTAALFVERAAFFAAHNAESVAAWLFLAGLFLGIVRFVIIAGLALAQWRMAARRRPLRGARPSLAVIVPAFNEERVVVETVRSILNSERDLIAPDGFDVLIVDDGSQDATAAVARAAFAGRRDVRVIAKANGGKASAINLGLAATEAEVIVVIDADTVLDRAALGLLARHFENARVGAVAGDAKVGNRVNTLTRFQALEYVTSQNLDRRAFETLNAMTVIPGAIGAWRRDALLAIGGFSSQTLAEDADATIHLQRAGWRVLYEPDAVAWTEAPETIGAFMKQRFRWMYGTLQAAFKHRDAAVRPGSRRIGWTILPNVFVFQVLFPLISPLMDGLMLWSVAAAAYVTLMHPGAPTPEGLGHALLFYLLFLLVELLGAVIGFCLDRREDWRLLLLIVAQRFCYRQLLYRTAIRAIVAALRGGPVGWGKLSRTAQVRARSLQARA